MSNILLAMLAVFASWAAVFYYLYFTKKWTDYGYAGRAALVVLLLILIPSVVITLVGQSKDKQRLAEQGFAVHKDLASSIGVSSGQGLSDNNWVFTFTGEASDFAKFYRRPSNRPGWDLTSDNDVVLVFRKGTKRMTVSAENRIAVFVLSEDSQP